MRAVLAVLAACVVVLALPGSARAVDVPVPTCNPAPANCSGWYRTNVTVTWSFGAATPLDCTLMTVTSDTPGQQVSCKVLSEGTEYTTTVTIKRDATPPQMTGATPARGPDSGGWYNQPLSVGFAGTDALSGIASCSTPTYGGGDGASVTIGGTCTDVAGNTSAAMGYGIKYDGTAPTVAATADRAPDTRKGWYRRPVTVSFSGADALSGVAACTEARRYAGPDRAEVELGGTCRDAAGNTAAELKVQLRYDATAPAVAGARARRDRKVVRVTWKRPADAAAIEVERTPGVDGRTSTVVYQGRGESFVDRSVRAGAVYRYEIRAFDAAGNVGTLQVSTGQAQALHRPAAGAVVRAPVVLAWKAAANARFYNVQLYRGGRKVLSAWPKGSTLRLGRGWVYAGAKQSLRPGLYRWYVWPARGTRERPVYGAVLGSSTFRVR